MDTKQKLKAIFERFIQWGKECQTTYPELEELFLNLLITDNVDLFFMGIKNNPEFRPIKEICKQADEEKIISDIKAYLQEKMRENNITEIDPRDEARFIKYLRLFAEVSLYGF